MSLYDTFDTDKNLELSGVEVRYNDVKFIISRAGGSNKKFKKHFAHKIKPFRSQIENESMDDSVAAEVMAEVYAETVILGWKSIAKDEKGKPMFNADGLPVWVDKMPDRDGNLMEFNTKNCVALLIALPELFRDLQYMASKTANFRKIEEEEDIKNL